MAKRFSVEAVFKAVDNITAPVTKMQNRVGKMTRGMRRGFERANKAIGGLVSGMKRAATAGVIAGAAIGFIAARHINIMTDSMDELSKRSRRLDFPIDEFQEWGFVAEQAGFSTQEFDKTLDKFTRNMGDLKLGTGTLTTILKKYNPELSRQLKNTTSVSDALKIYIDEIAKVEDPTKKSALAVAAFGKQGAKALNIAELGADGIKKLRLEMRENGLITEKTAQNAEDYNDAINSLTKSISALVRNALSPIIPHLTAAAKSMRSWVVANRDAVSDKFVKFFIRAKESLKRFMNQIKKLDEEKSMFSRLSFFVEKLTDAIVFLSNHGKSIAKLIASIVALSLVLKTLGIIMAVVNIAMMANPVGLVIIAIAALVASVAGAIIWWDELKAAFNGAPTWFKVVAKAFGFVVSPIFIFIDALNSALKTFKVFKSFISGGIGDVSAKETINNISGRDDLISFDASKKGLSLKEKILKSRVDRFDNSRPQVSSPQERVARSIEENRSSAELTIRDDTGRAELTGGSFGNSISMTQTGAM